MIMAGGANNTTYPNGERGLFANRPPKFLFGFWGAGGHCIPPPPRNANTVPAFRRSLTSAQRRHDLWRPRYPHLTKQRGRHRMRWPCDAMRNDCGPTRPARARPTWPPGSAPKKTVHPATVGHCEQVIYKCPRERGPICAQRNGSRAAATAGTGRGNRMGGGMAMRMACRRAGDW